MAVQGLAPSPLRIEWMGGSCVLGLDGLAQSLRCKLLGIGSRAGLVLISSKAKLTPTSKGFQHLPTCALFRAPGDCYKMRGDLTIKKKGFKLRAQELELLGLTSF